MNPYGALARSASLLVLFFGILSDWNPWILIGLAVLNYSISYADGFVDGEEGRS